MNRKLLAVVTLTSGAVAAVFLASITDVGPGNRSATCSVRVSDECLAQYPSLKRYEAVRFPVVRSVLGDGGLQFLMPRALGDPNSIVRDCIEVLDWATCDLDTCATYPATCASWDAGQPMTRVRAASRYVIPDCRNSDGGWDKNHAPVNCGATGAFGLPDGGPRWAGCNVLPRTNAVGPACLDAPSGNVFLGERLEDSL